jgi:hypothetical protein
MVVVDHDKAHEGVSPKASLMSPELWHSEALSSCSLLLLHPLHRHESDAGETGLECDASFSERGSWFVRGRGFAIETLRET